MSILEVRGSLARAGSLFSRNAESAPSEAQRSQHRFRRIAMTGVATMGARGVAVVTSLVGTPLAFRYLGAERYGVWMTLTAIIGVMGFADLGIGNGVVNTIAQAYGRSDRGMAQRYLTSALALLTVLAVLICFVGVSSYPYIPWTRVFNDPSRALTDEGAKTFLVLFTWFLVNLPLGIVARVQSGFQEAYWTQLIAAGGSVISLAALAIAILARESLPVLVFASTFGTALAVLFNGYILFRRRPWLLPRWKAFDGHSVKMIFRLGLMFFLLQIAGSVGYTSDNIIISQILGPHAVSVFSVPHKLFSIVSVIVGIVLGPMWPAYGEAIARGDLNWVRKTFWTSCRLLLMLIVPVCLILALAGPWIIRIAVGKSLAVPHSLFVVLAAWGVVASASNLMTVLLNGASRLRGQAVIAVISGAINLALSILLTRRFGVIGVCLGSIISQLFISIPGNIVLVRGFLSEMVEAKTGASALPHAADLSL